MWFCHGRRVQGCRCYGFETVVAEGLWCFPRETFFLLYRHNGEDWAGSVVGGDVVQCTIELNFGTICWHVKMARENAEDKLLDMGYVLDN